MLKRLIEILDDRTVASLIFSIVGMVVILCFARLRRSKGSDKAEKIV
jgi:hypothetical protein